MDKFFKAIGRFFKKIWEWIRQTAWVQPVLLVILVFALFFSINPIINGIKSLVNSDDTGKFYEAHEVCFRDLYAANEIQNQKPNYSSKNLLNKDSGDVLVIYVTDTSMESDIATFYNSSIAKGCKLYIVNFSKDENKKTEWKNGEYVDNDGAYFYDYLLTELSEAYNSNAEDSWRNSYVHEFEKQYSYSPFFSTFSGDDTYKITGNGPKEAKTSIYTPSAVKYHNGKIVDMRFASSNSFSNYSTSTTVLSNYQVLADLWIGVTEQ